MANTEHPLPTLQAGTASAPMFVVGDTFAGLPSGTEGDIAYAKDTDVFYVYDGADWQQIGAATGVQVEDVDYNNDVGATSVETTVYTHSITGGTIGASGHVRVTGVIVARSNVGYTATVRCKWGATVLTFTSGSGNEHMFFFQMDIQNEGSETLNHVTAKAHHVGTSDLGTWPDFAGAFTGHEGEAEDSADEDTTAAVAITVTFDWGGPTPGQNPSARLLWGMTEIGS